MRSVFPSATVLSLFVVAKVAFASRGGGGGGEPNPPPWNTTHVRILDPDDEGACQKVADELFQEMGGEGHHGQFSNSRYAVLFRPGFHDCMFSVGFYTTLHGLGRDPTKTEIREIESVDSAGNALDNFWRGAENFKTGSRGIVQWHVSQAAPMRRVQIEDAMKLGKGWSSGGYMSNCNIKGNVNAGSQQQWFNRNNDQSSWTHGAWSFVHLGCRGAPDTRCGKPLTKQNWGNHAGHTNIERTPIIAEKPYIVEDSDGSGKFTLIVPGYERNKVGYDWHGPEKEIPFEKVYVANEFDSAAKINAKLRNEVDHVLLQPGQYLLDEPIRINKDHQVLLGIGMPTLKSMRGNSCVEVGDTKGVRVAGMILEPGSDMPGEHLLRWGTTPKKGSAREPGVMSDVFGRVGGNVDSSKEQRQVRRMVQINNSYVVVDHTWLWRADHDVAGSVAFSRNFVEHGLEVNGHHVKGYGLFVEHTLGNMLQWNGEDGEVYMYQSELPYDVTQVNYAGRGYHSYRVADHVRRHKSYGAGVYSYFRDHEVHMDTGIKTPYGAEIKFTNAFIKMLNGHGGIDHILNDQGGSAYNKGISYLCGERISLPISLGNWAKIGITAARLH